MAPVSTRSPREAVRMSPRSHRNNDSPSRQIQLELEKTFSQLHLQEHERQKLYVYNRRLQLEELDAKEIAQAEIHRVGLEIAAAQHETVRQQAEAVLEAHLREEEEKRRRREEEQKRLQEEEEERRLREEEAVRQRAEQERLARQEKQKRQEEERKRAEADRLALAEQERAASAAAEEKSRREREATAQREKDEREKRERAEQEAALARKQEAEQAAASAAKAAEGAKNIKPTASPGNETENRHSQYLVVHRKLKTFRKEFWETVKQNKPLKTVVGDMRRDLKKDIGLLTDDKANNKRASDRVKGVIMKALKEIPTAPVAVNDFLPQYLSLPDSSKATIPSLIIYLLSMFSKAVINAFVKECAVNTKAAEPIGTLAAQIFSLPELQFARPADPASSNPQIISLVSILLAKFHATAPILFGIGGSESTKQGRLRLGWRTEDAGGGKAFVPEQQQYDRMTGLGAGYASIALRNFSKTKLNNPLPPVNFWQSIAQILNTPPDQVQVCHLLLLKAMLDDTAVDRFILFFGAPAIAVLRQAIVHFPLKLPQELQKKPAAQGLSLMASLLKTSKHLTLN